MDDKSVSTQEVFAALEAGRPDPRDTVDRDRSGGRHPSSERLHELLKSLGDLHDRKQADYGTASDPFANVRASQEFGIPPWVGALVRLNDKIVRLKQFARRGSLKNESAVDSMMDIAVYALIALVLYEEEGR